MKHYKYLFNIIEEQLNHVIVPIQPDAALPVLKELAPKALSRSLMVVLSPSSTAYQDRTPPTPLLFVRCFIVKVNTVFKYNLFDF
jgi:hypothetical protein